MIATGYRLESAKGKNTWGRVREEPGIRGVIQMCLILPAAVCDRDAPPSLGVQCFYWGSVPETQSTRVIDSTPLPHPRAKTGIRHKSHCWHKASDPTAAGGPRPQAQNPLIRQHIPGAQSSSPRNRPRDSPEETAFPGNEPALSSPGLLN